MAHERENRHNAAKGMKVPKAKKAAKKKAKKKAAK